MKKSQLTSFLRPLFDGLILFLSLWLAISAWWVVRSFDGVSVSKILYHLTTSLMMAGSSLVSSYLKWTFAVPAAIMILYLIIRFALARLGVERLSQRLHTGIVLALMLTGLIFSFFWLRVPVYLASILMPSNFIEVHYVDPQMMTYAFPEKKPNLIYIFLESMENTYADIEHGGIEQVSLIPNLTQISQGAGVIAFSNKNPGILGGFHDVEGTSWTAGAMVAQTSGVPLLISLRSALFLNTDGFLSGAHSIGEILDEHGYQQTLLVGSDAIFGQRREYFVTHGNYRIFDYPYAIEAGLITEKTGSWGFEDRFLYQFARGELTRLSQDKRPFNLTMLTVDTHSPNGDLCPLCGDEFAMPYKNVVACADRQISDFLEWAKAQPWYDETVIIVVSDHLSMDVGYSSTIPDDYDRTNFNAIIHARLLQENVFAETHRDFTALDLYPVTLAAMGVAINGDRLALGTNLFSHTPTLAEEHGLAILNQEFVRYSRFYERNLMRLSQ